MIKNIFIQLLKFRRIRFLIVKYRYLFLKKRMKFFDGGSKSIAEKTIRHNLTAFNSDSGFGCGQRMGLLIYPVVAHYTFSRIPKAQKKVLIVGCRTEDDIFWMKAYGFENTFGFDLFSYSKYVLVGDIHKTDFESGSFDIVLLGWMIPYTKDPKTVILECRRILKSGGLLGIGIQHVPTEEKDAVANTLNSSGDIISLLDETLEHKVLFEYDHYNQKDGDLGVAVVSVCH